jgi:hypothetical protein
LRWFKHLAMAHADDAMDALLERHGAAGYGAYWLILEDIAAAIDGQKLSPEATHSERRWCEIAHLDRRVFRKVLQNFREHLLQVSETHDGRIKISVPKLLKYRDEYSKKSGHAPHKLPPRTDTDTDTDTEQTTALTLAAIASFFPNADQAIAQRIAAAARQICAKATDAEIAEAVRLTHKRNQESPGLWLTTVPAFLKNGGSNRQRPPGQFNGIEYLRDLAKGAKTPACSLCNGSGRILRPHVTEKPGWVELPESELYEQCACQEVANGATAQ